MCQLQCAHMHVYIARFRESIEHSALSMSKRKASYDFISFKLKTVKFTEEKTKEAAVSEFHKVLTAHQL